jgi:hypothetical protein
MTFWLTVGAVYVLLLGVGLAIGRYLAARFPGTGRGWGDDDLPPMPTGPMFGVDWPELGSAFDRAFMPAAFTAEPVAQPA